MRASLSRPFRWCWSKATKQQHRPANGSSALRSRRRYCANLPSVFQVRKRIFLVCDERLVQNDTNRLFGKSVPCAQMVLNP